MKRLVYYSLIAGVIVIGYLFANSLANILAANAMPVPQETLHQERIYAYRDWQSIGVQLHANETVEIRAQGEWLYTPGDYHGPAGHPRYPAPSFYPIADVPGGVLIGKVGETGTPFVIGDYTTVADYMWEARAAADPVGFLYLRINDDILSDNRGSVAVAVTVNQVGEYASGQ
jgi:glucose dehydrogenase